MDDDLVSFRLVGVSHYQEALARCSAGERVRVMHEPDNPHDLTALCCLSAFGETIGYVPRASWLHRAVFERGRGLSGSIASLGYSRACLLGALVSVAICDDEIGVRSYFADRPAPTPPPGGFRFWIRSPNAAAPRATARR